MQQVGLKKNDILENIFIEKLVFGGMGFAKLKHSNPELDGRVIFVTGGAIPGEIVNLRVLRKKKSYIETQISEIIKKSPIEKTHPNNPYGMSGAWKWINIPYQEQLKIKENQVKEAFKSLEKYFKIPPLPPPYQGGEQEQTSLNSLCQEGINQNLPLDKGELEGVFGHKEQIQISPLGKGELEGVFGHKEQIQISPLDKGELEGVSGHKEQIQISPLDKGGLRGVLNSLFLPIESSPIIDGYRNKTEFSFGKYISHKEGIEQHFNVGFHKPGDFSKVEDFEGTPLIDDIQNEIFREIKRFTKTLGLPVYDQMKQEGFFRHLMFRKTYFANEMMILLSFNPEYFTKNTKLNKNEKLNLIKDFFFILAKKYPIIKSIYFSHNTNKADIAIGDLELIYGEKTIKEKLHGLIFYISPTSFFQTNSVGAEKLYEIVLEFAGLKYTLRELNTNLKDKLIFDLYSGTGTIGMIFAKYGVKKVVSVESEKSASNDGEENAKLNGLKNIEFINIKVEEYFKKKEERQRIKENDVVDLIIIDPPRIGMHPKALEDILKFDAKQIIYVSCNPATLVRDLEYVYKNSDYKIKKIKPMDMFPHTHHIETVVSLIKNPK